jgi:hypothetical protein
MTVVRKLYDNGIPDFYPATSSFVSPIFQEIPESVLAREDSSRTFNLLEKYSYRNHLEKMTALQNAENHSIRLHNQRKLEIGGSVANSYLNGLNSEHRAEINSIEIEPIIETAFLGFGRRERGIRITFNR